MQNGDCSEHCKLRCLQCCLTLTLPVFLTVLMFMLFLVGTSWDNSEEKRINGIRGLRRKGECMYVNRTVTPTVCFGKQCSCQQFNDTVDATCDALLANHTVAPCNNGRQCCAYRDVWCRVKRCDRFGPIRLRKCHWVDEVCGQECEQYADNQRCHVYLGECDAMHHVLVVSYGSQRWTRVDTGSCGIDLSCDAEWQAEFPLNQVLPCVFDVKDPLGTVTINGQLHEPYKRGDRTGLLIAGLVFLGVSCCLCAAFALYTPVQSARQRWARYRLQRVARRDVSDEFLSAESRFDSDSTDSVTRTGKKAIPRLPTLPVLPESSGDLSPPSYRAVTTIIVPLPSLPNYTDLSWNDFSSEIDT